MSRFMLASAITLISAQWMLAEDGDAGPAVLTDDEAFKKAAVGGKYERLLQKFEAEIDRGLYSEFHDYGYSSTARYAKQKDLPPGYWVYVYPNWYIWGKVKGGVAQPAGVDFLIFDEPVAVEPVEGRAWGPEQATGPPNTPEAGDLQTAWASRTQDGQEEWLELTFENNVIPSQVEIHETFNPGAVFKVSVFSSIGEEHTVWEGDDPTPVGMAKGVSKIDFQTKLVVNRIRIYLDSKNVPGWNEIDAVGLRDKDGGIQWAQLATASSSFADQQIIAGDVVPGAPAVFAQPNVVFAEAAQPQLLVPESADAELSSTIKMREKQMAKLLKQLRNRKKELEATHKQIRQLQKENAELRQRLEESKN